MDQPNLDHEENEYPVAPNLDQIRAQIRREVEEEMKMQDQNRRAREQYS